VRRHLARNSKRHGFGWKRWSKSWIYRTLEWDAEKGVVVGDEPATARLRRAYRAPWVHPEP